MEMSIQSQFQLIGARVKMRPQRESRFPLRVDIRHDAKGPYFDIELNSSIEWTVLEAVADDRHLLLMANAADWNNRSSLFLCGHDEKAWFVAAIPEKSQAATVAAAKDALKPDEVWDEICEHDLPENQWNLRRTRAFIRQGEWFFLPRPWLNARDDFVLHNEPIWRSGGRPHNCEMLYRLGGVSIFVSRKYRDGLTENEFRLLDLSERAQQRWRRHTRGSEVYVRGRISHPDHEPIDLPYWHKVVMNTETGSRAMGQVAFLD